MNDNIKSWKFFIISVLKIGRSNILNKFVAKVIKICMLPINIKLNFMVIRELLEILYLNANIVLKPHWKTQNEKAMAHIK